MIGPEIKKELRDNVITRARGMNGNVTKYKANKFLNTLRSSVGKRARRNIFKKEIVVFKPLPAVN